MSHRRTGAALAAAVVAMTGLGCPRSGGPAPPLEVQYAGCPGARPGPVCEHTGDGPLILWARTSEADLELELDHAVAPLPELVAVQGGVRLRLQLPEETRHVGLRRRSDGAAWGLDIEPPKRPPWHDRVQSLIDAQSFDPAIKILRDVLDGASRDGEPGGGDLADGERGLALALLGQLTMHRGETRDGQDLLRRSLPFLRRAGDLKAEIDKTTILTYGLIVRDRAFTEARERLDALPLDWQAPGEALYFEAYYRGLLAMAMGDARAALAHLEEAVVFAERTGSSWYVRAAEEMVAVQLLRLGRYGEAAVALGELLALAEADDDPCREAGLLGNLGLNALYARELDEAAEDPRPALERALETLEAGCTDDLPERQNGWLNLASAELRMGRPAAAREALARAAALPAEPGVRLRLWQRDLEGRLAFSEGRHGQSLEIFESLARAARGALVPDVRWRALVGIARARRALGDEDGALDAFRRAEHGLEAELLLVPLQEGRESFLARRERATAEHLELLLERGGSAPALELARRSRLRLLRALDRSVRLRGAGPEQRRRWETWLAEYLEERAMIDDVAAAEWTLALGALETLREQRAEARRRLAREVDAMFALLDPPGASPGPSGALPESSGISVPTLAGRDGSVALVIHPLPASWVVFVHREGEVRVLEPDCRGETLREEIATCLLRESAPWLEGATEIRILAAGALADLDFHALPFGGDVLLAQAPVIYDLDLDPRNPRTADRPRSAVVVADAAGDLPRARLEAAAVAEGLASAEVAKLEGRAASAHALGTALPAAELLHVAGHARFAGRGGWRTFLPLADGGRLSLEDVLLLESPPRWVVLSGCETARTAQAPGVAEGIGLAQAFLAAGSQTVVAAVRPVEDLLAAELVELFYPAWLGGETPAEALRRAQLEIRRRRPAADWSSFRVLER